MTPAEGPTDDLPVVAALLAARRVTAICHENPDADTIGAAIAVAIIAEQLGKEAEIVSVDPPAPAFGFLPRFDQIIRSPRLEPDVAVVCDAASLARVGSITSDAAEWLSRATLINIDHHVTNDRFGDVNHVDADAAATCQVIAELLPRLGVRPDADVATALLAGIVRDSHGFSDPGTSARTLRSAADLVEAGGDLAAAHRMLVELPTATMALWGKLLDAMVPAFDGRIIYTILTKAMLDETDTRQHDADGLVEFMANAKGVDVALLLREVGPTTTRVSIRTNDRVDATRIAAAFGGGGHASRAGCTMTAACMDGLDLLLPACERELAGLDARRGT
ncbi:MAG: DHH family phosphoesterase [Candidatus Limnocylindria bacterium]